MLRQQQKLR